MGFQRRGRIHDERVGAQVEEVCSLGVRCHRMAHGGDEGPASRGVAYSFFVVGGACEEVCVACSELYVSGSLK